LLDEGGTPLPSFPVLLLAGAAVSSSASFCAAVLVLMGIVFHHAIDDVIATLNALGEIGGLIVFGAVAVYLAVKAWERVAFARQLQMDRISVEELVSLMHTDPPPVILDVRSPEARAREGVIPGSLSAHPSDMHPSLSGLNKESEIVIYCACPNEASAAVAATHLKRAGFRKIRPLRGGIDAWLKAGYQLAAT
jgi:rhodanese-related sulfurtransferase